MTQFLPAPPEHPQLPESRIRQVVDQLAHELRREQSAPRRLARRQLVLAAAAAAVLLTLVGAGYAVGKQALDAFDLWSDPHGPARIGDRVEIASVDDYSLHAWKSTQGICLGVVRGGKPEASGCGMPVVGAPPDQVFRQPEREVWVEVPEQPDEDILADAVIEAADARELVDSGAHAGPLPLEELIAGGESRTVEFKSSARWSYGKGDRDEVIERAIVKAVAGFMNAHGGNLLIGVDDDGAAIGLERDYKLVKGHGRDGFENWLTDLLEKSLGKPAVANVAVSFAWGNGADICRVGVRPSRAPVYARRGQDSDLFVRLNNSTRLLNTQEAVTYIAQHWATRQAATGESL